MNYAQESRRMLEKVRATQGQTDHSEFDAAVSKALIVAHTRGVSFAPAASRLKIAVGVLLADLKNHGFDDAEAVCAAIDSLTTEDDQWPNLARIRKWLASQGDTPSHPSHELYQLENKVSRSDNREGLNSFLRAAEWLPGRR